MAYSEVGVVNVALYRIGEEKITALSDDNARAIAANDVWEYIRNLVLEEEDWRFAKTRTTISKVAPRVDINCGGNKHLYVVSHKYLAAIEDDISIEVISNTSDALSVALESGSTTNVQIKLANATGSKNTAALIQTALRAIGTVNGVDVSSWTVTANSEYTAAPPTDGVDEDATYMVSAPSQSFNFAYTLPTDFLKIAGTTPEDRSVDPTGAVATVFQQDGMVVVRGTKYAFVVETLPDKTLVLLTDYDDDDNPLELVYIRLETDPTKWTAAFINALADRMAAELALDLTEDKDKWKDRMKAFEEISLPRARKQNFTAGYIEDEAGSDSWEYAGR